MFASPCRPTARTSGLACDSASRPAATAPTAKDCSTRSICARETGSTTNAAK